MPRSHDIANALVYKPLIIASELTRAETCTTKRMMGGERLKEARMPPSVCKWVVRVPSSTSQTSHDENVVINSYHYNDCHKSCCW